MDTVIFLLQGLLIYLCLEGLMSILTPSFSRGVARLLLHPGRNQILQSLIGAGIAIFGLILGYVCFFSDGVEELHVAVLVMVAVIIPPLVLGGIIMTSLNKDNRQAMIDHLNKARLRLYGVIELTVFGTTLVFVTLVS